MYMYIQEIYSFRISSLLFHLYIAVIDDEASVYIYCSKHQCYNTLSESNDLSKLSIVFANNASRTVYREIPGQ